MTAITYRNTITNIHPASYQNIHTSQPRGVAYESATHFVHYYASDVDLCPLSVGIRVADKKTGSLTDWVIKHFGATDIRPLKLAPGSTVKGVWRPGIMFYQDSLQSLGNTEADQRSAEQALRLLVERLDDLLLYVEPDTDGLRAYSHKSRELLILACTELENSWKYYMREAGAVPSGRDFSTTDYVRLLTPLYLAEYEITWTPYGSVPPIRPFNGWSALQPTQSLAWYDAYNKTKHDRSTNFAYATLAHALASVAANIVMFAVRFGPYVLFNGTGTLPSLVNNLCRMRLRDFRPETYYAPVLKQAGLRDVLNWGGSSEEIDVRNILPFAL